MSLYIVLWYYELDLRFILYERIKCSLRIIYFTVQSTDISNRKVHWCTTGFEPMILDNQCCPQCSVHMMMMTIPIQKTEFRNVVLEDGGPLESFERCNLITIVSNAITLVLEVLVY